MLNSKNLMMRLVEESDAEYILNLRLDNKYNSYLSQVVDDLDIQRQWIRQYKQDEKNREQFYFIIEKKDGTPCGTVRIYDLCNDSFCWGSWILDHNKTKYSAIESAFLVYDFGFTTLGYQKSRFDVRKENKKVIDFHEKFGAEKTGESEIDIFYEITKDTVFKMKEKFKKFL